MKALHVLDVLDTNKSIPRIALKMAEVFEGTTTFTAPHIVDQIPFEVLSIKESIKAQKEFDMIHLHTAVFSLAFRRSIGRSIHHFYGSSKFTFNQYNLRHQMNEILMARRFGLVISCSEYLARQYEKLYHRKSEVIYPGVDVGPVGTSRQGNTFHFLFVGVLKPRKRVSILIVAMTNIVKLYSEAKLTIVGSGPDRENLEILVKQLGLSNNVSFTGRISDEELNSIYQNSSVYVSASEWEGFGMPLLEAMSFGKPLVVSNCEAHEEIIKHSGAGYSVERNPKLFAKFMIQASKRPTDFRENAIRFAIEHSWSGFMKKLLFLRDQK